MRAKLAVITIIGAAAFVIGCSTNAQNTQANTQPPPPPVLIAEVVNRDVPIYSEFPAQTYARNMVEVRGRVEGYIDKWLFKPGQQVIAGQPLYLLDSRPYQAAVQQASGNLRQSEADLEFARQQVSLLQAEADLAAAQANLVKAQQDYERLKPLVEQDAAAKQDLDAAVAALRANEARVRSSKANVEQARLSTKTQIQGVEGKVESLRGALSNARLNLDYGTIRAPISGLAGDTLVPVGGLVTPTSNQPLTTIVPLDPIWVRFQMSESQYLAFKKRGATATEQSRLELVLADNTVFGSAGQVENTLNQVDPRTGTLELQARFANPQKTLLPGQFGHVRFRTETRQNALIVPQRAIQQVQSMQTVYTVGPDSKVQARPVKTADRVGDDVIVEQGLKPGDHVIVEGQLRVRPGIPVQAKPYQPEKTK